MSVFVCVSLRLFSFGVDPDSDDSAIALKQSAIINEDMTYARSASMFTKY